MSCLLAPSILSFDLTNIRSAVETMTRAGAQIIHLDVMDGQFVPPITFGADYVSKLRSASSATFEAHLMTETPERHFEDFQRAGCERILFHIEATQHSHRLAQSLRAMGVSPGVAINPGTPAEAILPILDLVDLVLVMTVNPGWGGQQFIESALDKVSFLRKKRPDLLIEVDGGINPTTLETAKAAGANVFVVGNHLAKASDLEQGVRELVRQCG
jgi:ribulose-phosphate 3-epimerase